MIERHDYTPAALYARVSSDRQDVDLSVAAQLRALRDHAQKNGYIVVREYVDEAESGRIADRPEFRKMIDAASQTNAPFQEILVWKFSRFTRKREHAVAFKSMLVWGAKAKDNAEPVRVEKAFPAIITKAQFNRVGKLMRARAPKRSHPRRVGSTYLLSGLVKCKACGRALSGQDAKSGQFSYYVCQSIMKRGKNACVTPRLNARRFEQMIVDKIRSNILTEGSITELVRAVDEEMDGIASEQRKRLETIDTELEDVKRRLGRIWNAIETSDIDIADASDRVKEHRERKERLEDAAADARAILSQRRAHLDDVKTISAYAKDMKDFLQESELTERRSFIESFVKEIIVIPGDALIRYTVPMPDDSFLAGRATEKVALDASVLSTVHVSPPCKTEFITRPFRATSAASAPPMGLSSGVGME